MDINLTGAALKPGRRLVSDRKKYPLGTVSGRLRYWLCLTAEEEETFTGACTTEVVGTLRAGKHFNGKITFNQSIKECIINRLDRDVP